MYVGYDTEKFGVNPCYRNKLRLKSTFLKLPYFGLIADTILVSWRLVLNLDP